MDTRIRRGEKEMAFGYTPIARMDGEHADMLMDFGALRLRAGEAFEEEKPLECAYLLVYGEVRFSWNGRTEIVKRGNCFDNSPYVLHVPAGTRVRIEGVGEDSELTVHRTGNPTAFEARLYLPSDTPDENRGAGTMKETCTRIVRTVFDKRTAPWSNLVLGEVINTPGKWSSYPPHIHPQPEIYYYKFCPENGYGYSEYGEDVLKVRQNDTVFLPANVTHPQVAGPGYALWYMWVIRHLDGDPYVFPKYPYFLPEHAYIMEPGTVIWPDRK